MQYDSDAAVAILQFRDGGSGDVEAQYPSKQVVREYQLRGREGLGFEGSDSRSADPEARSNRLLSLAREGVSALSASSGSAVPGFGVSRGVTPTVAASPTVSIAGGGNVVSSVNFVA
ncbi:hypothetical protein CHU95_01415 [Niveispirillum lacus]|uniref:Uncharacterized protein n=1 Tax=Niveispirillum lacus TaxID=1981099 RepID=A0A255Z9T5_9PROT|nr:hypothetical protein CHU95_01415 [Niveispirillum lacus]